MSSTEPISMGSIHGYGDGTFSPVNFKSPRSRMQKMSRFVQEDIQQLLEYVPQVEDLFTIVDKIGQGTFSQVYLAKLKNHPKSEQLYALKHIIPTSHPSRIENELRCLEDIGGCDNVMGVELCLRERDHVVIVMPYFSHQRFQDYILDMDLAEIREYMKNLLIALRRIHHLDIIHRDVKPSNFLYDRKTKRYSLVDFGLAQKAPVPLQKSPDAACLNTAVNIKRKTRQRSVENDPSLSPSKRQRLNAAEASQRLAEIHLNQKDQTNNNTMQSPVIQLDFAKNVNFTPPTPNLDNFDFSKTYKSPRRALLAKRALLANPGKDLFSSRVVLTKTKTIQKPNSTCDCYGNSRVCSLCMARPAQIAPRAGTPGFRSPEVLMRCPQQTTAVDIWSAGVMFLSLLSGRTPFFRAKDDMNALAQIIAIRGSEEVKKSALTYGKNLVTSPQIPASKLDVLCKKLRQNSNVIKSNSKKKSPQRKDNSVKRGWTGASANAYNLLEKLLDLNPHTRITATEALNHSFFSKQ